MKIKLVSDFRDYYDHWFDLEGEPWERLSTGGMDRPAMLSYLESHGIPTVGHDWVRIWKSLCGPQRIGLGNKSYTFPGCDDMLVVVYTALRSHRGEDKLLMPLSEAVERFPAAYASQYQDTAVRGYSERLLVVGGQGYRYSYQSDSDWRSNCGNEVTISKPVRWPLNHEEKAIAKEWPLFAIDYVRRERSKGMEPTCMPWYVACDFNIAPGLKGTGMEDLLAPLDAAALIMEAIEEQRALHTA